jgi:hypothetical protein
MDDRVNVQHMFDAIDRVEESPFADCVFMQVRQIQPDDFVPEILDVRCKPLGFLKQALCHRRPDCGKILDRGRLKREAIPGHRSLPAEPELVRDILS